MPKFFAFFLFVSLSSFAHAIWSGYAYVSPATENKFNLKVYVAPTDASNEAYLVKLKAVAFPFKQAWVITTPQSLSPNEQIQRDRFWGKELIVSGVEMIVPLRPTGINMFEFDVPYLQEEEKLYELVIPAERIHRTYIYIDSPVSVDDGGYYYSIDIGSYVKNRK